MQWGEYYEESNGYTDSVERVLTYQISYSTIGITTAIAESGGDFVEIKSSDRTSCTFVWWDRYSSYKCYTMAFWHSIGY